jgi:hypothetical protein
VRLATSPPIDRLSIHVAILRRKRNRNGTITANSSHIAIMKSKRATTKDITLILKGTTFDGIDKYAMTTVIGVTI